MADVTNIRKNSIVTRISRPNNFLLELCIWFYLKNTNKDINDNFFTTPVIWNKMPHSTVGSYRCSTEKYCLHLHSDLELKAASKNMNFLLSGKPKYANIGRNTPDWYISVKIYCCADISWKCVQQQCTVSCSDGEHLFQLFLWYCQCMDYKVSMVDEYGALVEW